MTVAMLAVVLLIVLFISGWIRRPLSRMVEQMKAKETVPPSGAEELRFVSETYKHITFYGWVQGVGFRYRARHAAELYGCTGWVRNEWDGSVTMEIQGTEDAIDKVILAIEAGRYVRIENMDSRTIPVETEERGFRTM